MSPEEQREHNHIGQRKLYFVLANLRAVAAEFEAAGENSASRVALEAWETLRTLPHNYDGGA